MFLLLQLYATVMPSISSAIGKFFQLEELEDKDKCTTEVMLNPDHTVTVGETDGPVFKTVAGRWKEMADGTFKMTLTRRYESGREKSAPTDMGEFEYEVERIFTGEMTKVGGKLAVSGVMHNMDKILGDEEVGFFNMIDTSKENIGKEDQK